MKTVKKIIFPCELQVEPLQIAESIVLDAMDKTPEYFKNPAPQSAVAQFDFSNMGDARDLVRWLASFGTKVKMPKNKPSENPERNAEIEAENRLFIRGIFINFILREIVEDRKRINGLNAEIEGTEAEPFKYKYEAKEFATDTGEAIATPAPAKEVVKEVKKPTPLFKSVKANPATIIRETEAAKKPVEVRNDKPKKAALPVVTPAKPPVNEPVKNKPVNKPVNTPVNKPVNVPAQTPAEIDPDNFDLGVSW